MAEYEVPTRPVDADEADAFEQALGVSEPTPVDDDAPDPEAPTAAPAELPREVPLDADPADAYEQSRVVEYDEDDYR